MPFASQIPHDSKALPGVKFTVHRIGFGRRTEIDMATLAFRQRMRELEADYPQPSDQEKPLMEQLAIAERKALAVPADQLDPVMESDVVPLQKELAAVIPEAISRKRGLLNMEYAAVDRLARAEWIRAGLVSIEGGELDGMTADQLLDYGPPDLAQEVYAALIEDGRTRGESSKNSQSLSTSGSPADGESKTSTVQGVEVQPAVTT